MTNSVEEQLQAMVNFDTVNSFISGKQNVEMLLCEYLEAEARTLGLTTQRLSVEGYGFNLLMTYQAGPERPWLLFESHLDTVSTEGMSIDPFAGVVKDGRLYGRGACDTKGTGAAMFWALRRYRKQADQPNNIALLYTLDEESFKTGVRTFAEQHLPTLAWKPVGAIVGEPTQLKPVIAHNGVVRWRIRTDGVAAHSSEPTNGRSAISMMTKVIEALESDYIPNLSSGHSLTGPAQCSINIIHGGVQINIIPDLCEIHLDRRIVPGEAPEDVLPAVELTLDKLRQHHPEINVTQIEPDHTSLALDPVGGEAFAARVAAAIRTFDLPDELVGVGYGTDASDLANVGIPAIVLGPGNIAQAHTHDEWIDVTELNQGVKVYLQVMQSGL